MHREMDLGNYYGAFPSGLSIYDNTLRYYFNVGPSRTKPVLSHTFPIVSGLQLKNNFTPFNFSGKYFRE
jgi:hypothetical protein